MNKKSIYKYAAEAGLPTGLYLSFVSLCSMLSVKISFLNFLILPLLAAFPFFIAWKMKNVVKDEPAHAHFSPLWLFGIYTIIFGTLICMLVTYSYLLFIDPSFIRDSMNQAIEALSQLPEEMSYGMSDIMQKAAEKNLYPTKTQFVTSMGWFTCFAGSMLSLILALIISRRTNQRRLSMFR